MPLFRHENFLLGSCPAPRCRVRLNSEKVGMTCPQVAKEHWFGCLSVRSLLYFVGPIFSMYCCWES